MTGPLENFLNALKVVALEKVSFSDRQNSKTGCWDIDSRWEALSA